MALLADLSRFSVVEPVRVQTARRLWPALLIAASAISTLSFACVTPFVAFAVAAAYVLPAPSALLAVAGIWLANQAVGFTLMSYPWDATTILWGVAIGAGALIATASAGAVLRPLRPGLIAPVLLAFAVALVVYEVPLYAVSFVLGGEGSFTMSIISGFALLNLAWVVPFIAGWEIFERLSAGRAASGSTRAA